MSSKDGEIRLLLKEIKEGRLLWRLYNYDWITFKEYWNEANIAFICVSLSVLGEAKIFCCREAEVRAAGWDQALLGDGDSNLSEHLGGRGEEDQKVLFDVLPVLDFIGSCRHEDENSTCNGICNTGYESRLNWISNQNCDVLYIALIF